MRTALTLVMLSLLATGEARAEDQCMVFLDAFWQKLVVSDVAPTVFAGGRIHARIEWTPTDIAALESFDELEVAPAFSNRIPGSALAITSYFLKSQGVPNPTFASLFVPVSKYMVGLYELNGIYLWGRKDGRLLCYTFLNTEQARAPQFLVGNDLEQIDIYPPILTQLRFESSTAKPGDIVRLIFKGEDKNAICTAALAALGQCGAKWHQTLAGESRWLFFDAGLESIGGGEYAFSLVLPQDTEPGSYRLKQINVSDIAGNFLEMPPGTLPALTITPL